MAARVTARRTLGLAAALAVVVAMGAARPAAGAPRQARAPMRRLQIAAPSVASVEPAEVAQGQTVTLTLRGTGIRDGLVIALGPGVTATPVTHATGTAGTVTVTVAANAAPGTRALATAGGGRETAQAARLVVRAVVRVTPGLQLRPAPPATFTPAPREAEAAPAGGAARLMYGGAELRYDSRGCPDITRCLKDDRTVYVPPDKKQSYFWWNVDHVPGAGAVRWQVIQTPLVADALALTPEPAGVVSSGIQAGTEDEVELDVGAIARGLGLKPFVPAEASAAGAHAAPGGRATVRRPGPVSHAAPSAPSSLYVRVIPVRSAVDATPVGRPSDPIRLVYGTAPAPELHLPNVTTVPGPSIAVTRFEWVPDLRIKNWPSGCEPIPRDTGTGGIEALGEALVSAWDWASHTYAAVENAVVDVAHTLLPFVPKSVLNVAMQAAMAAAGIPPNIPNLDQLMHAGADYLAESVAAEIPVPGSDALAGLTVEEFKDQAREAARKAILAGAEKARDELSGKDVKYCREWERWPSINLTIRNTGDRDYEDVHVGIEDSAHLFKDLGATVPILHRGQQLTIPVTLIDRSRMNVQITHHTQLPEYDESKAEGQWWDRFAIGEDRVHGVPARRHDVPGGLLPVGARHGLHVGQQGLAPGGRGRALVQGRLQPALPYGVRRSFTS